MKRLLLTLLLCTTAFGEEVTLSWTPPTASEDCVPNTTVPVLAGYNIYELITTVNDPTATSVIIGSKIPGTYTYVSSSVTTSGAESKMSNIAEKVVVIFTVANTTVFTMIRQENRLILLPVGTVPLGTTCDATQSVNGYYAVSRDQVTWSGTIQPVIVLAQCL